MSISKIRSPLFDTLTGNVFLGVTMIGIVVSLICVYYILKKLKLNINLKEILLHAGYLDVLSFTSSTLGLLIIQYNKAHSFVPCCLLLIPNSICFYLNLVFSGSISTIRHCFCLSCAYFYPAGITLIQNEIVSFKNQ